MGKSKAATMTTFALPLGPWLYINDPMVDQPNAKALQDLLPVSASMLRSRSSTSAIIGNYTDGTFKDSVNLIVDDRDDDENHSKIKTANEYRVATIKYGCNFVSINLYLRSASTKTEAWGTNHLDLCIDDMEADVVANSIYKSLFKIFTPIEHLHLIPEKEMLAIDDKAFPLYEYCPISESRNRCKDAKIQFVAIVTSRPEIGPNKRLQWTVADRSGSANFYFQWRGPESQYTWDWVLKLQPGDRKALPRMPCIKIKEKKRVQVIKAPFRGVGLAVGGAGFVIKSVGKGLFRAGNKVKMGSASEWVPEADVKDGKKIDRSNTKVNTNVSRAKANTEFKVFNEKGQRLWGDEDSVASTRAESVFDGDEKTGKEFC